MKVSVKPQTWIYLRMHDVSTIIGIDQLNAVCCLGANISQRPAAANERTEIGHWEVDTVQGLKNYQDSVLLVLTERYSRLNITRKTAQAVNQIFLELK